MKGSWWGDLCWFLEWAHHRIRRKLWFLSGSGEEELSVCMSESICLTVCLSGEGVIECLFGKINKHKILNDHIRSPKSVYMAAWLTGWISDWLGDWLTGCLTGWLQVCVCVAEYHTCATFLLSPHEVVSTSLERSTSWGDPVVWLLRPGVCFVYLSWSEVSWGWRGGIERGLRWEMGIGRKGYYVCFDSYPVECFCGPIS